MTPFREPYLSSLSSHSVSEPGIVFFSKERESCEADNISYSFLKEEFNVQRKVCFR